MKAKLGALAAAALVAAPLAANAQVTPMPGFYIGALGGVNFLHMPTLGSTSEKVGFAVGGVAGYDFVGPRVELAEVQYVEADPTLPLDNCLRSIVAALDLPTSETTARHVITLETKRVAR